MSRIGDNPHTPALESKTVQRARGKALEEIVSEQKQMTDENIQKARITIGEHRRRNPHQPVSGERFTKYTGPTPQSVLDILGNG